MKMETGGPNTSTRSIRRSELTESTQTPRGCAEPPSLPASFESLGVAQMRECKFMRWRSVQLQRCGRCGFPRTIRSRRRSLWLLPCSFSPTHSYAHTLSHSRTVTHAAGAFWPFCLIVLRWSLHPRACISRCRISSESVRGGDGNMGWYRKEKKYLKCVAGNPVAKLPSNKALEISDWVVCVAWFPVRVIELAFYSAH